MSAEFSLKQFRDALHAGRLLVARCTACGAQFAFPTPSCFACGSPALEVFEHSGAGRVFSWVVNHYAFDEQAELPSTVLLVELTGGARVYARLAGGLAVAPGMDVHLDRKATAASAHPVFAPSVAEPAREIEAAIGAPYKTCYSVVREVAGASPSRPAFELIGLQTVTYAELLARIDRCAAVLAAAGVKRGDRVAVMAHNRVEVLELWLACSKCGAVFVPFNPALRGPILTDMLELAEPALIVCEIESVNRIPDRPVRMIQLEPLAPGTMTNWDATARDPVAEDPEALSIIMFTSGTTGRSKGVMWSSMSINCMAASLNAMMEFDASDRLHTALPMFHGNALILSVFAALMLGGTALVSLRFSASGFSHDLERSHATATSLLSSMTNLVLAHRPERPFKGSLRKALVIPAPKAIVERIERRFGCRVATAYGCADAGLPLISGFEYPDGACGRVFESMWDAKLIDPSGNEVPPGGVGELAVRPHRPFVAAIGYWRMPEATEAIRLGDWIRTGDLLRQDEDGWFAFVDRTKDMIRRRGENVSSQEVEAAFERHPDILECAAYPVPSDMSEDEVMLAVVRRPGSEVTALELIRFAEPDLPYFAIPRYVRFMDRLPKNATAKILKASLRDDGIVADAWDLAASSYSIAR